MWLQRLQMQLIMTDHTARRKIHSRLQELAQISVASREFIPARNYCRIKHTTNTSLIRDGQSDRDHIVRTEQHPKVAVLLCTYNGAHFVELQIRSLIENTTRFILHWLDDHSTDNTREIVRSSAQSAGIELIEWQQSRRLGLPISFFHLLECVEADIYLFCDQDDIWQPGKIDATVNHLLPDLASRVLCFSDTLLFSGGEPETFRPLSDVVGKRKIARAMRQPLTFGMFSPAIPVGHTQGFTRPVRELFLQHRTIAHTHALLHDLWMHDIAVASGTVRMLSNVPTAFWRQHEKSFDSQFGGPGQDGYLRKMWRAAQLFRQLASRHAQGFILAAPTLRPSRHLDVLLELAQLTSTIDQRQSPVELVRLMCRGVTRPILRIQFFISLACLCSDATAADTYDSRLKSIA